MCNTIKGEAKDNDSGSAKNIKEKLRGAFSKFMPNRTLGQQIIFAIISAKLSSNCSSIIL